MKITKKTACFLTAASATAAIGAGLIASPASAADSSMSLVTGGSYWRFNDTGVDQGTAWRTAAFDQMTWKGGFAQAGYGDGDELTKVAPNKSAYQFRQEFTVADASRVTALNLAGVIDDGAVAYLNGVEVWRHNLAANSTFATLASAVVDGADEGAWKSASVSKSALVSGKNVLAIEVHNRSLGSSDISFDAKLTATTIDTALAPAPAPAPVPAPETTKTMCKVTDSRLGEISGLTASVNFPGILWTHNDSGDGARIFAIDSNTCAIKAEVKVSGAGAYDWEGTSMGRTATGKGEIWIGDTGNNAKNRSTVQLYRFEEPSTLANQTVTAKKINVSWSETPKDVESLIVEPKANGRVFFVSKEKYGGMYQLQGDFRSTGTAKTGTRILNDVLGWATDAATAPDGSKTVIRAADLGSVRNGLPGTTKKSVVFPHQQQGEAITFSIDSRYVFIASEGLGNYLIRIPAANL